jgi:serine/threonine protein phosphatase 1
LLLFRRAQMARQLDGNAGAIVFLRGSQEEMWHKLLQVHFAPNPRQVIEWMLTQGVGATLRAYGSDAAEARTAANGGAVVLSRWTNQLRARMRALDGHEKLMTVLRRAAFTADHAVLFVNAGLDPALPLAQQRDAFWWRGGDFDRIDRPYNSFQRVVRGADPWHRGLVVNDHTTSIDAGCGFGGPLVAACFDPEGNVAEILEA